MLKIIGIKTDYKYDSSVLKTFNNLQIAMIGYMKMKYPRGGQNFVPTELMNEFKTFDMVEQPENDILSRAGIYFGSENNKEIVKTLKEFFNLLIDELDTHFPIFQELLQEKIFAVTKEGKFYTVNHKIGRKIP